MHTTMKTALLGLLALTLVSDVAYFVHVHWSTGARVELKRTG